jgi:hypothetical protein
MVLNVTFNNISAIPWWSVLLVEETGVTGKNTNLLQIRQTLSYNAVSGSTLRHEQNSN